MVYPALTYLKRFLRHGRSRQQKLYRTPDAGLAELDENRAFVGLCWRSLRTHQQDGSGPASVCGR
jgi:hypothetical protein